MVKATSERVDVVKRAKAILAVHTGKPYTQAAQAAGYKSGDSVSQLVERFNQRETGRPADWTWAGAQRGLYAGTAATHHARVGAAPRPRRGSDGDVVADDVEECPAQASLARGGREYGA